MEKRRFRAEANTRRAALLDGQITSGNWQNISWKITRAYSEAFRFLASGSIQCSFANETLYPLRVRDELRQIFAAILHMYRMCINMIARMPALLKRICTMVSFFIPVLIKKKGGGEPFLVLRLILSGG